MNLTPEAHCRECAKRRHPPRPSLKPLTAVVFLTLFAGSKPPNIRSLCLKTRQNLSASHCLLQTSTSRMHVVLPSTTFLNLEVEDCELTSCCLRRPHQAQTTTCVKFRVRSLSIPTKVAPSFSYAGKTLGTVVDNKMERS